MILKSEKVLTHLANGALEFQFVPHIKFHDVFGHLALHADIDIATLHCSANYVCVDTIAFRSCLKVNLHQLAMYGEPHEPNQAFYSSSGWSLT